MPLTSVYFVFLYLQLYFPQPAQRLLSNKFKVCIIKSLIYTKRQR